MEALVLLLALVFPVGKRPAQIDAIEVNRVYNDDGQLWLEQVIFWRWEQCVGLVAEGWRPRLSVHPDSTKSFITVSGVLSSSCVT